MAKRSIYRGNVYLVLLFRLLLILFFFGLSRIIFYAFNTHLYPNLSFQSLLRIIFFGLRFDIAVLVYLNALFTIFILIPFRFRNYRLYRIFTELLYFIPNILALAANYIDIAFIRFTGRRTTFDIFNMLESMDDNIWSLVPNFIRDYPQIFFAWVIMVILFIFFATRIRYIINPNIKGIKYFISAFAGFILCIGFLSISARGGFQLKPIGIITAGKYASGNNVNLVLNTPFTLLFTINNEGLENVVFYENDDELNNIFTPYHTGSPNKTLNSNNVVIIILESFSKEHIGALSNFEDSTSKASFTPFLDSLIQHSYTCYNAYANGTRSIESIPAIISGFPTLMDMDLISSPYASNNINSLISLLKPYGYYATFFHGGNNGTMNFDSYAMLAGYDEYYGRNEYNNDKDYDGKWGIFDEEFLQYMVSKLDGMQKPFLSTVFTLSSHHPYTIPEKHKERFLKGDCPIQECIMYSDYALKNFFESIYSKDWFSNTLFVITADHTSEICNPEYNTLSNRYAIPIIFFSPSKKLKGKNYLITQQIDIMPSILDLMNFPDPYISFGTSIFNKDADRFAITYSSKIYQIIKDDYLFQRVDKKPFVLYNLKTDPLLRNNIVSDSTSISDWFFKYTSAFIQQYNHRIINNNLIP
ncbi:LTA synthase family protein [Bacteroidota bacterium]